MADALLRRRTAREYSQMNHNKAFENCDKCGTPFPAKGPGGMVQSSDGRRFFFCDRACRRAFLDDHTAPESALSGANAINGVKISGKRKPLSQSQIKKKMRPRETNISKVIGKQLDDFEVWNTRTQSGQVHTNLGGYMRLCRAGTPDRIFAAGLHVWIEVKRPGETPSPTQLETICKLKENGALVF